MSVVIPVFNEAANLEALHERLAATLDALPRRSEVLYVDDGSSDESLALLRAISARDARVVVLELARNSGQHAAVVAGFAASRGAMVVTLDADLQNPPEEIPRLLEQLDAGNDVVGTWREHRQDAWLRRALSALVNRATAAAVGVAMRDYGCMLRAYRREIVEQIVECDERSLFIPALANALARRTVEIEVAHSERAVGKSKYKPLKLMRLGFDLLTGFSLIPIQLVSLAGICVALAGVGFGIFLFIRRLIVGPEVEGVFTLFAILFVFLGILILAVGLVGEYIGRIYLEVRHRPAYRVRTVYRGGEAER
ncbi:MAG: glycosyltransferase [Deltaproteobacteria bacterium]|nr:glycosyltransferase [Deltaproteobacteria bacterium]